MTTKEAFLQLVSKKKWYVGLAINPEVAIVIEKRLKAGLPITNDKMDEILEIAGYVIVQEKQWVPKDLVDSWNSELDKALKGQVFNAGGLSRHFYQININDIKAVEPK